MDILLLISLLLFLFLIAPSTQQNLHIPYLTDNEDLMEYFQYSHKKMAQVYVDYCPNHPPSSRWMISSCGSGITLNNLLQRTMPGKEIFFQFCFPFATEFKEEVDGFYLQKLIDLYCDKTNIIGMPIESVGPSVNILHSKGNNDSQYNIALMFQEGPKDEQQGYNISDIEHMSLVYDTYRSQTKLKSLYIAFESHRFTIAENGFIDFGIDFPGAGLIIYKRHSNKRPIALDKLQGRLSQGIGMAARRYLIFLDGDIPQRLFSLIPHVRWSLLPNTKTLEIVVQKDVTQILQNPDRYSELKITACPLPLRKFFWVLDGSCVKSYPVRLSYLLMKAEEDMVILFTLDTLNSMGWMPKNTLRRQFLLLNIALGPNANETREGVVDLTPNFMNLQAPFHYIFGFVESHFGVEKRYSVDQLKDLTEKAKYPVPNKITNFGLRVAAQFLATEDESGELMKPILELRQMLQFVFVYDNGEEIEEENIVHLRNNLKLIQCEIFLTFNNELRSALYKNEELPTIPTDQTEATTSTTIASTMKPEIVFPTTEETEQEKEENYNPGPPISLARSRFSFGWRVVFGVVAVQVVVRLGRGVCE